MALQQSGSSLHWLLRTALVLVILNGSRPSPLCVHLWLRRWRLSIRDRLAGEDREEIFDAVLVCTGHHGSKHLPKFPGADEFQVRNLPKQTRALSQNHTLLLEFLRNHEQQQPPPVPSTWAAIGSAGNRQTAMQVNLGERPEATARFPGTKRLRWGTKNKFIKFQ